MKNRILRSGMMAKAVMIGLLLGVVGTMKGYAYNYNFSSICPTGQRLYYKITDATNHFVALVAPNSSDLYGWDGFTKPIGDIVFPSSVVYNGANYTVTSIGNYAFHHCIGLTGELIIPSTIITIGNSAFSDCRGFTGDLIIPNSVTSIGSYAFGYCNGFTGSLTIGNSVTQILFDAFYNCSGFKGTLIIGDSVTKIWEDAFKNCSGFTGDLIIPNSVTTIGSFAFSGCRGFTGSLTIGDSVINIGTMAFYGCSGFAGSLNIGNSVTTIGDSAFGFCNHFTNSLSIPNSVTTIGEGAFMYCNGFTGNLTIGNSVVTIGNAAFSGCIGVESITIESENTIFDARNGCNAIIETNTNTMVFGCKNSFIPNTVTVIGNSAFAHCSSFVGNLTIPNSVISIEQEAFYGCSGITGSLTIPNSVISIGMEAFEGCCGFTGDLIISDFVTTIGDLAFEGCNGFSGNLTIPNSVISIGNFAFSGCSGFDGDLTIGNSVTSIGFNAFSYCTNLTGSLTIPNSVCMIGDGAFSGCKSIEEIIVESENVYYDSRENCNTIIETISNTLISGCKNSFIPSTITTIGCYAFSECNFSGNLFLPNSVTSIREGAFLRCSGLTGSLIIPNAVNTIGNFAFLDCSGFDGILLIGNSVAMIGEEAFRNCSNLIEVIVLGAIPPSIEWGNFYGTNYPIYVPYESLNDYKIAANWCDYDDRIFPMSYKTTPAYNENNNHWQFIASPLLEGMTPEMVETMLASTTDFDLYQFNQSGEEGEWQNFKADTFNLINGQGYLYASAEEVNVIFKGEFNEDETKEISLAYDANAPSKGWNLVGNPFPCTAYINREYYVINEDGTAINPVAVSASTPIPPCTGVMVKAEAEGETVVFTRAVTAQN